MTYEKSQLRVRRTVTTATHTHCGRKEAENLGHRHVGISVFVQGGCVDLKAVVKDLQLVIYRPICAIQSGCHERKRLATKRQTGQIDASLGGKSRFTHFGVPSIGVVETKQDESAYDGPTKVLDLPGSRAKEIVNTGALLATRCRSSLLTHHFSG